MEETVPLFVRIRKEIRDGLYELIRRKYRNLHGGLRTEVEHALAHWLEEHHTQIHTKFNPALPRAHRTANQIIMTLKSKGYIQQATLKDIANAIIEVCGSDERTIRKWTKFLVANGYLKTLSANVFEIL